jgi:hypothetical protein
VGPLGGGEEVLPVLVDIPGNGDAGAEVGGLLVICLTAEDCTKEVRIGWDEVVVVVERPRQDVCEVAKARLGLCRFAVPIGDAGKFLKEQSSQFYYLHRLSSSSP